MTDKADDLISLIKGEHNERKKVIYNLVKDFRDIAQSIKVLHDADMESGNSDTDYEDQEAPISAHALAVVSDSIKDLLQVGIKNDELLVKIVDICYKYNKKTKSETQDSDDESDNEYEKHLLDRM